MGTLWLVSLFLAILITYYLVRYRHAPPIEQTTSMERGVDDLGDGIASNSICDPMRASASESNAGCQDTTSGNAENNIERLTRLKDQSARSHWTDVPAENSLNILQSDFIERLKAVQ